MTINWSATKTDKKRLRKIAERATMLYEANGIKIDSTAILMDITACHLNGNQLRLQDLLQATDFNFAHDINGIRSNIDRRSGCLTNCFRPRFAKPVRTTKTEVI